MAPFYRLLGCAFADYESLRHFLATATNAQMSQMVLSLIVAGFFLGSVVQVLVGIPPPDPNLKLAELVGDERTETEKWFHALPSNGDELAIREATTERCSPHIDVRWTIGDLIKELQRPENQAGSDILDRKVVKLFGLQVQGLKPTQNLDDAKQLLSLRYGGLPSRLEWQARTEEIFPLEVKAFITVRTAPKTPGPSNENWHRCLIVTGPSEALAVTIAAMRRETWMFRSHV